MIKGKFIDNLPKVYGIYTGGFIVFIILMAIAEQAGMSAKANRNCFCCIYNCYLCDNRLVITYTSNGRILRSGETSTYCI